MAAIDLAELSDEQGRKLLADYQSGDVDASERLKRLVTAACEGAFDDQLSARPEPELVHVTTSSHLLTLAILNRLHGITAARFYKGDALRYIRTNLLIQKLLGLKRLTIGWPVYAFGAEALGQVMMYPEDQAPGSDPGQPLVSLQDWRAMPSYDADHDIARLVRDTLIHTAALAKIEPVAHLPGPYSLAAEILGQETVIGCLSTDPQLVRDVLDLIVDRILAPWCEDLVRNVPDVWLELSDASGSPMFIGPQKFFEIAVDPARRLIEEPAWGDRVFVANYRGDKPPRAATRGRRKAAGAAGSGLSFASLLQAKRLCCPHFLIRLEADAAPAEDYASAAIEMGLPLYLGIGAVRLDRNSVVDHAGAADELRADACSRARLIGMASEALQASGRPRADMPWPGDLYIEDTNGETDIALFTAVLEGCAQAAPPSATRENP